MLGSSYWGMGTMGSWQDFRQIIVIIIHVSCTTFPDQVTSHEHCYYFQNLHDSEFLDASFCTKTKRGQQLSLLWSSIFRMFGQYKIHMWCMWKSLTVDSLQQVIFCIIQVIFVVAYLHFGVYLFLFCIKIIIMLCFYYMFYYIII